MDEEVSMLSEMRRLRRAEPFHSFTLVMSSGDRYEIVNPDSLAFSDTVVVILPRNGASIYLRQAQINGIEQTEPAV